MRLADKVALITGAAQGIGKSCAEVFIREGARVAVADKNVEQGEALVSALRSAGGDALFIPVDVIEPSQVEEMVAQAVAYFGKLDILISNAGLGGRRYGDGPVHLCTLEAWDFLMDVNLRGTFLACKYSIPQFLKQGQGVIVTMASVLGMFGTQGLFDTHAYAVSKAGIIGLTRTIAAHYAHDHIRANAIAPGLVDTAMAARTKQSPEMLERLNMMQPLGGIGEPRDVAEAALFLASDDAKFITGTVLPVDGGWSAW